MFLWWFLLNIGLKMLSVSAFIYGYTVDPEDDQSFDNPNIYMAKLDSKLVVLIQRNSSRNYNNLDKSISWTNVDVDENIIIWKMSSNNCKTNDHYWPKRLSLKWPNPITTIPQDIFKSLHVKEFIMKNVGVTAISKQDFKNGYFLESIHLSNNSIVVVPSFVFSYAPLLIDVDLSNNDIEEIAEDAFLHDSTVNPFKDFLFFCIERYDYLLTKKQSDYLRIQILTLDNNRLTTVNPKWFKSLTSLISVSLSFNQIRTLDASVVFSENLLLKKIVLKNNQLTDLTKIQFKNAIEEIRLSNNPVEAPNNLYAAAIRNFMWNVRHDDTVLTISPQAYILDAGNNSITSIIAENPSGENSLVLLKIDNNRLSSISNIIAFQYLERLYLAKNLLTSFDSTVFERLTLLRFLDLSYNLLEHFELNIKMPNLQELHVAGNKLTTIDSNLKSMAPNLVVIGLRDNNWNCQYLTTAMFLLHFNDILPVINGSTDTPESYKQIKYDDSIKGVKCFNNVNTPNQLTIGFNAKDINVIGELTDEVHQLLNDKLIILRDKLIAMLRTVRDDHSDVINDKFNEFFAALSTTAGCIE